MLEALHAVLVGEQAHVAMHAFVPPGDGHVEGVVAGGFLRPAAPFLERLHHRLPGIGDDEIDDARRAAREARRGAAVEIVARHRAHERQLHVGVRVDAAGHHVLPAGVDHLAAGGIEIEADLCDHAVDAKHIGAPGEFGIDDGAAADQGAGSAGHVHGWSLQAGRPHGNITSVITSGRTP
jgi:hypothetical protein